MLRFGRVFDLHPTEHQLAGGTRIPPSREDYQRAPDEASKMVAVETDTIRFVTASTVTAATGTSAAIDLETRTRTTIAPACAKDTRRAIAKTCGQVASRSLPLRFTDLRRFGYIEVASCRQLSKMC